MISDDTWTELMARGRTINRFDAIDGRATALLVVDLQSGFLLPEHPFGMPRALALVPLANRMAEATRATGGRVVWTRYTYADHGPRALAPWQTRNPVIATLSQAFRPGSAAHVLHPDLAVDVDDVVIDTYRYSAFTHHSSALHDILQAAGTDTVVVMGCAANTCCESTARDAYQLGYRTLFLADGNAAPTPEEEAATLMNVASVCADVRSADEVVALLEGRPVPA